MTSQISKTHTFVAIHKYKSRIVNLSLITHIVNSNSDFEKNSNPKSKFQTPNCCMLNFLFEYGPCGVLSLHVMHLDEQSPVFRKEFIPWYDSNIVCFLGIVFLVLVFLFSITGISVARENPEYHEHMWIPGILAIMSMGVLITTAIRLIRRYTQ